MKNHHLGDFYNDACFIRRKEFKKEKLFYKKMKTYYSLLLCMIF